MQEEGTEPRNIEGKNIEKDKIYVKLSRIKRKILKHVWAVRIFLLGVIFLLLYLGFVLFGNFLEGLGVTNFLSLAKNFLFTPSDAIESIEGRTNILILGKGGKSHEAPDLTDTIIFASFSHDEKGITIISLPRDIWIPSLRAKLNSAYYWGNQKEAGGGLILAKAAVEEIVGEPVQYGLVVDFSGFKEVIDVLGGVEVNVEHAFTDEEFPIPGRENDDCGGDPELRCRYETISFEEGNQIMDGETALKFVRSRHAQGDEGTDFARARRQQKVIDAIQRKILSRKVLFSPSKISELVKVSQKYVETDFDQQALAILARRFLQSRDETRSFVLDGEFLENPPISPRYDNLYVFVPKDGSWEKVHAWVEEILSE